LTRSSLKLIDHGESIDNGILIKVVINNFDIDWWLQNMVGV